MIDDTIHKDKKIVDIDNGWLCMQSLPCYHDCTITYEDGSKSYPRLFTPDNVALREKHGLPRDAHLDEVMRTAAKMMPGHYGKRLWWLRCCQ